MCIACFRPIDHRVESELLENLQDIDFEDMSSSKQDLKSSVLDAYCTISCTYLWDCMLVCLSILLGILCFISFQELSLLPGFG
jgi:hypothetical protein